MDDSPPKYPRSDWIIPLNQKAEMCLQIMLQTYNENKIRNDFIISTKNGNFPTKRHYRDHLMNRFYSVLNEALKI